MNHIYNNWSCKIFEGFYESNLYNSDTLYWITKTDTEEGYLKQNEYYDIDSWEDFTKEVSEAAVNELANILPNDFIIKSMKLRDVYSPKYYNYETDSLIIDIKLDLRKLKTYCFRTKKEAFNNYLKKYFTSCDDFISFIANNLNDFIQDYQQPDNTRELNTMIEFYLLNQIYNSDTDFKGFDTPYHWRLYEAADELVYKHLSVQKDTV